MKYIKHYTTRRYTLEADLICRYANLAAYFKGLFEALAGAPSPKLEQAAGELADLYASKLRRATATPANPTGELRNFWGIDNKQQTRRTHNRADKIEILLELISEQRAMRHAEAWKFFDDDFLTLAVELDELIKQYRHRAAVQ